MYKKIETILFLLIVNIYSLTNVNSTKNFSIALETCSLAEPIPVLGRSKAFKYSQLLFETNMSSVTLEQRKCIFWGSNPVNQVIRECSRDLTINIDTIPFKVAQGMSLNKDNQWVSACAPEMPCINFNKYLANGSVGLLMSSCGAGQQWESLLNNKNFLGSSLLGFTQCQRYHHSLCIYPEKKNNSNQTVMYACPVSKNIYTSNFMLFYLVNPFLATRLPGCRLRFS